MSDRPLAVILTDDTQTIWPEVRPAWEDWGDVVTVVPNGNRGDVQAGESCRVGQGCLERVVAGLRVITEREPSPFEWSCLTEGDTCLLRPMPMCCNASGFIVCPWWGCEPGQPWGSLGFPHWPILLCKWAAKAMLPIAERLLNGTPMERGYGIPDRFLGVVIETARVSVMAAPEHSHMSWNHIDAEKLPIALELARKGAYTAHGVKDVETYQRLKAASASRCFDGFA